MGERGPGRCLPTHQHATSPSNYVSGHCGSGCHDRCTGAYAGVTCGCPHHTEPAPPPLVAVHCFFACPAVVEHTDPYTAHAAMEMHYFDAHKGDIKAALWGAA